MYKNIYTTPVEQKIMSAISSREVVTAGEIRDLLPDLGRETIDWWCHQLSKKGYLFRLKKGTYLVADKPSGSPVIKDPFAIARVLFSGYIGFSSALRIYGLLDYEPFTVFVVTKNRSKEVNIGEYVFKSVAMGDKATGMTFYKDTYVSTLAKTFFDCFYKPQYAGGYAEITKALYAAKDMDWQEFVKYFYGASDALCQRTGYVLDTYNREAGTVPGWVLDYFRERKKNKTRLLPSGKGRGTYDREWLVMDNLGKENIMSWWHHG